MSLPTRSMLRARAIQLVIKGHAWAQRRRVVRGTDADELELYYAVGDPHSHLAARLLPLLQAHSSVAIRVRLVAQHESPIYPEQQKQRRFALQDVPRLASACGLQTVPMLSLPDDSLLAAGSAYLHAAGSLDDFLRREWQLADALFTAQTPHLPETVDHRALAAVANELEANNARRAHRGHYLPAMWQFRGDWFWGVDRADALFASLRRAGRYDGPDCLPCIASRAELGNTPPADTPLEFFFSFRSPYSYLAAVQLQRRFFDLPVPLVVRPVLPMAMRGFKVPLAKRMYIVRDASREAQRLDIPFGLISDPIGDGALRCLKAFALANGAQQQLDFLVSAGTGAWAEALDLATDRGLRKVCERAGMDWAAVQHSLAAPLPSYARNNLDELQAMGFWGVPSFRYGDFTSWGNDRLWMLDELMRRASSSG